MKIKMKLIYAVVFVFAILGSSFFVPAVFAKTNFYYGVWLPFWQKQSGATDISLHLDSLNEFIFRCNDSLGQALPIHPALRW